MSVSPNRRASVCLVGLLSAVLFSFYLLIFIPAADSLLARQEIARELIEQRQTMEEMKKLAYQMSDSIYRAQHISSLFLAFAFLFSCWVAFLFALNLYFSIKLKKLQNLGETK